MDLVTRLEADLLRARKARDASAADVLRVALGAIANAEAISDAEREAISPDAPMGSSGAGTAEVARRALTEQQVHEVVRLAADEMAATAAIMREHGRTDAADELQAKATLLLEHLDPAGPGG